MLPVVGIGRMHIGRNCLGGGYTDQAPRVGNLLRGLWNYGFHGSIENQHSILSFHHSIDQTPTWLAKPARIGLSQVSLRGYPQVGSPPKNVVGEC